MNKLELAARVKEMALLMAEVAGEMKYFGGFDPEYQQHGEELANAATTAWGWYQAIEASTGKADG
ncbi:MAG: hypothetical protein HZT40_22455 [Candidatus Thiothrix singaporensis]|uniref:Uncharacterized protein n=1 Tax=Candidatus Thiothrix singaporensis TaxID=2799669 RepID=A0A7L6AXL9_9GAMM|nr:MAG: hypothetical protein HZT40_22455 [Candidatus Thiothrix singaporensis]